MKTAARKNARNDLLCCCAFGCLRPTASRNWGPARLDGLEFGEVWAQRQGNHFVWKADGRLHLVWQGLRRGPPKAWCRECFELRALKWLNVFVWALAFEANAHLL
jgi:hypothetical protein